MECVVCQATLKINIIGKLETIWYDLGESGAMPFEDRTNGINDVWSLYRQGHGIARIFNLVLQISKDRTVFSMLVFFVISEFYFICF